jgi:hypothetical protein
MVNVLIAKKIIHAKFPPKICLSTESANRDVVNAGVKACGRIMDICNTPLTAASASGDGAALVVMRAMVLFQRKLRQQ